MQIKTSCHQERLWFIDQFEAGNLYESSPIYHNIPFILHLEGLVHFAILERSIREVVNRHEALRTKIVTADNEPMQSIADREEFKLKILELSQPEKESENETGNRYERALNAAIENSKEPFLLHKDTLIRGTLIPIEDKKSLLLLTLHHIIADRYSLGIIAREISIYYEAFLHNSVPQLPDLPLHYADFSQWQREFPEDYTEALFSYWKRKLRGKLQALELPGDYPRAAIHTFQEGRHPFTISETLGNKIKSMANREKTTVFVVLLAAFKILLSRYSGLEEIVVGTWADNRLRPGTEVIVGPLANLLVLRSNITGTSSFSTITAELNKTVNDAFKYADLPFDRLVSELRPDKDMSRTALFDVLFQYEETPLPITRIGNLEVSVVETNRGWGKYDLNMFIQCRETTSQGVLVYNKDYYNHPTISRLIDHYMILLQSIYQDPMKEISQLSILTGEEKQQLLMDWNQTQANYPRDKTLHQVFAEKVEKFPHRPAVIFKDMQLTYAGLNREGNRLAHYLRRHFNIQPNDLVAVLLTASPG